MPILSYESKTSIWALKARFFGANGEHCQCNESILALPRVGKEWLPFNAVYRAKAALFARSSLQQSTTLG